ncbi:PDDEXK nuclease domain-containing protein [Chitinophaga sp.]|uniref:PDDEXK nuclease domain-containing protein n=1 Tax=Chitinophaga sp. TaxID=1869181 RepID=UPI0031CE9B4A
MTQQLTLISEIKNLILESREQAIRAVDQARTIMYWNIGKRILEEEQKGKDRADYGVYLLKELSKALEPEFGSSFSVRQLELMRQFYKVFPITSALRSQLSWTHYRFLIRIDNQSKREYYIHEAANNNWTARQLERQINSQLYERLLLSNDKESLLAITRKERIPMNPSEIIKDPIVLEFLGMKREAIYYEKDLESSLITHLQDFMLELGNGFSFVARQKQPATLSYQNYLNT